MKLLFWSVLFIFVGFCSKQTETADDGAFFDADILNKELPDVLEKYDHKVAFDIFETFLNETIDITEINEGEFSEDLLKTDGVSDFEVKEQDPEVKKIGKYGVGIINFKITTKSGRNLNVSLWYPAKYDPYAKPYKYLGLIKSETAVLNAPPETFDAPYPLIAFSHGNQGLRFQSFFLTEYLAANGYLVVAPGHQYNTAFDFNEDKIVEVFLERPKDLSACIDVVLNPEGVLPDGFEGLADPDKIGVCGHSFGGYTSIAISPGAIVSVPPEVKNQCEVDPSTSELCDYLKLLPDEGVTLSDERIKASVPMAPGGFMAFRKEGLENITIPVFVMAVKEDEVTPYNDEALPIYENLESSKFLLAFEKGGHFTFANTCEVLKLIPPDNVPYYMKKVCGDDAPYPIEDAYKVINAYVLAFFEFYLKGENSYLNFLKGEDKYEEPSYEYSFEIAN